MIRSYGFLRLAGPIFVTILSIFSFIAPCHAQWDVAYIVGKYHPPGDKRISHNTLYLSDFHGRHRKQLTFGEGEPRQVRWVGRNHLAWIISNGSQVSIRMLNLRTWKTRSFKTYKKLKFREEDLSELSDQILSTVHGGIIRSEPIYMFHGDLLELTPEGFRAYKKLQSSEHDIEQIKNGCIWHIPGEPSITITEDDSHSFTTQLPNGHIEMHGAQEILNRMGRKYVFEFPGVVQCILPGRDRNHAWMMSSSFSVSDGLIEFLFDINWKTGKLRRVVFGFREIDFDPKGKYFSAIECGRSSAYGTERWVWTSSIYVGELATCKMWPIASGLVFGESVVLRPKK